MDFDDVQQALRDSGRDGLLAYDGMADPMGGEHAWCRGSWNIFRFDGRMLVSREEPRYAAKAGLEMREFDDPCAAYAFQFRQARRESPPHTVRSFTCADLPATLQDWLTRAGWRVGGDLFGNPLVAQHHQSVWRILETPRGVEMRRLDHPIPVNEPAVVAAHPHEVFACLMLAAGPPAGLRPLGWPKVGLRPPIPNPDLRPPDRVRHVSLDELAAAFGERDGGGVLDVLAAGVRLDLVTDDLVAAATRAGYTLAPFGGDTALFEMDLEVWATLAQVPDGFTFTTFDRGVGRVRAESASLAAVQNWAIEYFAGSGPPPMLRDNPTPPVQGAASFAPNRAEPQPATRRREPLPTRIVPGICVVALGAGGGLGTWLGIAFGGARSGGNLGTALGFLAAGFALRAGRRFLVGPVDDETSNSLATVRLAIFAADVIALIVFIILLVRVL